MNDIRYIFFHGPRPTLYAALLMLFCNQLQAEFSRGTNYTPRPDLSRFEQREQYRDALYLAKSGQRNRYLKLRDRLRTYPLYPYLEYADKMYDLSRQSPESIAAFINQYSDTPLAGQMLQNWLYNLARQGKWKTFVENYDPASRAEKNACFYGYALYKEARLQEAMQWAQKLWLVDFSQPEECDPIFRVWRDNDGLTPDIAWQRYSLALRTNEVKLATYLTRFLKREDRQYANSFKLVHIRPHNIKRINRYKIDHPRIRELVLHGIKRLARTRPDEALETLTRFLSFHQFESGPLTNTYVYIGKQLALSGDKKNQIDDLAVNLHTHPDLVKARIRMALGQHNWSQVQILINLLPEETQRHSRWQFWKARVLARSIDPADRDIARGIFDGLAESRNFYGFLAADRLQQTYSFVHEPSSVSEEEVLALEETPGIQRALELLSLDERSKARREWYFTTRDFSNRERQIAARVANKWGWYKPGIQSLIEAGAWNDLDFRFPIAYQDTFISNARTADIPVNWSLAIARQESAFMPDARSPVGAVGLMQLMPATAKLIAKRVGVAFKSNRKLTEPAFNIHLGSQYLGRMLRRYNNNRILATAAYNAGPGNVDDWINPELAMDVWIETIPFAETRNYVQNVLMFSVIYGRRLEQHQPLIYHHEFNDFSTPQPNSMTGETDQQSRAKDTHVEAAG